MFCKNSEFCDFANSFNFLKVVKKGNDHSRPQRGDICTLRIEGRLEDGTVFEKFDSFDIQVGDTEVSNNYVNKIQAEENILNINCFWHRWCKDWIWLCL